MIQQALTQYMLTTESILLEVEGGLLILEVLKVLLIYPPKYTNRAVGLHLHTCNTTQQYYTRTTNHGILSLLKFLTVTAV